jgi:flagellar hook-length control protein FliK
MNSFAIGTAGLAIADRMPDIRRSAVPQVASDSKAVAPTFSPPSPPRPNAAADQAPTPFASLLDDSTAPDPAPAPAPPPPQNSADAGPRSDARAADAKLEPAKSAPAKSTQAKPADDKSKTANSKPANGDAADADAKAAAKAAAKAGSGTTSASGDGKAASEKSADDGTDKTKPSHAKSDDAAKTDATAGAQPGLVADANPIAATIPTAADAAVVQVPTVKDASIAAVATAAVALPDLAMLKAAASQANDGKAKGVGKDAAKDAAATGTDDAKPASAKDAAASGEAKPQAADGAGKDAIVHAHADTPAHQDLPGVSTGSADASAAAAKAAATAQAATQTTPATQTAAVTPAAAPVAPQAAAVPLSGIAVEIATNAASGKSSFAIRLDPPELGRIDVRLDVDRDGKVTSRLTVDRADTLNLLQKDSANLERALQDAGLKTADNGLQFSLRDQSNSGQQNNTPAPSTAQPVADDTPLATVDVSQSSYYRLAGTGSGLDIRI